MVEPVYGSLCRGNARIHGPWTGRSSRVKVSVDMKNSVSA